VLDERLAQIVKEVAAARTKLAADTLLPEARVKASGRGQQARWGIEGSLVSTGAAERLAADVEFGLWAERLPELLDRIVVDVHGSEIRLAVVPRPEWAAYFRRAPRMFVWERMFRIAAF
jgi:hypothetical protein